MKIFCYDDDVRLKAEGLEAYSLNSGSFGVITNSINKVLGARGLLGTEEDSDIVGFASGLKWHFGFENKKRFLINVWETNILPQTLINWRQSLPKDYVVFGLSEQISQVWRDHGFPTDTVDIGVDAEFWHPMWEKRNEKFTILSTVSCNFRSGINNLIAAFMLLFKECRDIKLIIKNTDERATKIPIMVKQMREQGMDVEYICARQTLPEIRDLMATCHVMSYPVINTSAGLPILEAAAMEIPVIVNDFSPVNIYPTCAKIPCRPTPISKIKDHLVNEVGLPYTFPEGWIDETKANVYWPNTLVLAATIRMIKDNFDIYHQKAMLCREEVIKNWSWEHSTDQLLKGLGL